MRHDDRHVGEVDRDIVDIHRVRIFEPHVVAAAHAGADAGLPCVEQRGLACFLDRLVERIGETVIWEEALHRRVELEALHAELVDEAARLARTHLSLVRIDRRERDQNVTVLRSELRDFFVFVAAVASLALRIDRKDHGRDVFLAEVRGRFGDSRRMLPWRAEIFRHRALQFVVAVVGVAAARLFRMRVDVDRSDLRDLDHVSSSQAHDRGVVVVIEPVQKFLAQRQHLAGVDATFRRQFAVAHRGRGRSAPGRAPTRVDELVACCDSADRREWMSVRIGIRAEHSARVAGAQHGLVHRTGMREDEKPGVRCGRDPSRPRRARCRQNA